MKSNIKVLSFFFVLCILITGCKNSSFNKKININNINSDISGFYKKFSTDYLDEEITVVNKDIIGWDGEVVKYIDTNNKVSRCTVIIYGEHCCIFKTWNRKTYLSVTYTSLQDVYQGDI